MTKSQVTIYTDGGCDPNPGVGGWGVVLIYPDRTEELSGGAADSTNNQMELTAAIEALNALHSPSEVLLYTDSTYLRKGITEWMHSWVKKGWRTAGGKPVKNVELWQKLYDATRKHDITWKWVKGHAGNTYNEQVDQLASREIARIKGIDIDYEKKPASSEPENINADVTLYFASSYDYSSKQGIWVVKQVRGDTEQDVSQQGSDTSENQLLLEALISTLNRLPAKQIIAAYTNSEYLSKGMSQWVHSWRKNGWKTASKKPVKNRELWEQAYEAAQKHTLHWLIPSDPIDQRRLTSVQMLASKTQAL